MFFSHGSWGVAPGSGCGQLAPPGILRRQQPSPRRRRVARRHGQPTGGDSGRAAARATAFSSQGVIAAAAWRQGPAWQLDPRIRMDLKGMVYSEWKDGASWGRMYWVLTCMVLFLGTLHGELDRTPGWLSSPCGGLTWSLPWIRWHPSSPQPLGHSMQTVVPMESNGVPVAQIVFLAVWKMCLFSIY